MELLENVQRLEKELPQIKSVEELRFFLRKQGLKFIVIILSESFNCLPWNVTHKEVSKVLDLTLRVRISKISDENEHLETLHSVPIRVKEVDWVDLDNLFEILKQGI
ncbi:MAG: hypothetical protein KDK61_05575, partial [Simkania sp.]|nr:hypothetical protein [Simkania sp.]